MRRFLAPGRLALACCAAGALLLSGPATASAMTVAFRVPIDLELTNQCNGDVVDFTGTAQVLETLGPSPSPESNFRITFGDLRGTGASGETYILNGVTGFMGAGNFGAATVVSYMTILEDVSLGPAQNEQTVLTLQLVFDSQGNIIEMHGTTTDTCHG
jgi:hypothetical protein